MSTITAPGIYDMPPAIYHADPCPAPSLSSGIGRMLMHRSARHAWYAHPRLNADREERESSEVMERGTIMHKMVLGAGQDYCAVDAPDWRKKEAQTIRDTIRAAGSIPILEHKLPVLQQAVAAMRAQLAQHAEASDAFTNGKPEQALIWQEDNGIWCRALLDWMPNNPAYYIDDLKTTAGSAAPHDWERNLQKEYAFQAAFYMRGSEKVRGRRAAGMRFVVTECDPPHGCCVMQPAPSLMMTAEAEVRRAVQMWGKCLAADSWPGYPDRVCHIEAPAWMIAREAETLEEVP